MGSFAFHPELFERRAEALELLADHGLEWLTDFAAVDLAHDVYGLEVCGLKHPDDARTAERLLRRAFGWRHSRRFLKEDGSRDPGWKVIVSRDPEPDDDRWDRVG